LRYAAETTQHVPHAAAPQHTAPGVNVPLDRCHTYLRFYRAILSRNLIARQSCNMQLCMSYTATLLPHKQELTSQRSAHFRDKVAQNRAMLYSEKELRDCLEVARRAMSRFAIL